MKRQGPIKIKCTECGKEFGTWPFILAKRENHFCSTKCMGAWNTKNRPRHKLTPSQKEAFFRGKEKWAQTKGKSEEHRKKMSDVSKSLGLIPPSRKGMHNSLEHRKKQSIALKGRRKENPISPLYSLIRKNRKSIEWRQQVFIRDNFTCRRCGAKSGNGKTVYLEAHHITAFSVLMKEAIKYMPLLDAYEAAMAYDPLWDIGNGETLCQDCHDQTRQGRPKR